MVVARSPYKMLRGTRSRPLLPHRLLQPKHDELRALAELMRAAADATDNDPRWNDAADALDVAADALVRLL